MDENIIKQKNKLISRRINIIKGQVDGLKKMIEKDEYCIDLLRQSRAIQNSLKSLDTLMLERHLHAHVLDQFINQKEEAIKELLKVFEQSAKSK